MSLADLLRLCPTALKLRSLSRGYILSSELSTTDSGSVGGGEFLGTC